MAAKRTRVTRSSSAAASASSSPVKYQEPSDDEKIEDNEQEDIKSPQKRARLSKPKVFVNKLDKPHPEPRKWKEQLVVLENQRKSVSTPMHLT